MDSHTPAGTSLRTAVQFAQNYDSGMQKNEKKVQVIV